MDVDPALLAIALSPPVMGWSWYSFVDCVLRDRVVSAFGQLNNDTNAVALLPIKADDYPVLASALGQTITVLPPSNTSATWRAEVALDSERTDLFFTGLLSELHPAEIESGKRGASAYYRIIFRRLVLPGYLRYQWMKVGNWGARNLGYTPLRLFDRKAIVSEIRQGDTPDERFVALSFKAEYLSQLELDAFEMVLYILAGTGGIRQSVDSVDVDFRWIGTIGERHGHAIAPNTELIFPHGEYTSLAFYERVAGMIECARVIIEQGVPLRALLFHIFSSQQMVPEITITHLAIALEGFKNAVVEKVRREGNLMERRDFKRRIKPVIDAAERAFSDPADGHIREHVVRRIMESNNWSGNKRWKRFWSEYISYTLTADEERVLGHRGSAIHNAYILLTEYDLALNDDGSVDDRPYDVRLKELERDAGIYRNVVNRVLLRLLGYDAPFLDFSDAMRPLLAN
jgi:hypothetical protein